MVPVELLRWNLSRCVSLTLDDGEFFYYSFFMASKYDDEGGTTYNTNLILFFTLCLPLCYVPRETTQKTGRVRGERRDLRSRFSFSAESTICRSDPSVLEPSD